MIAALAFVLFVSGDMPPTDIAPPALPSTEEADAAEVPVERRFPVLGCDRSLCISSLASINKYVVRYSMTVDRAEKAERERDWHLKNKGCVAKLEVTQPPKTVPNFKLERTL